MKKTAAFTTLLLACIFHIISAVPVCADPLVITPGLGAGALVNNLMGTGVTYSNAVYTGAVNANGTFTGGTGVIGFESGIILSSGLATAAAGPNTNPGTTTVFSTAGDPDLNALGSTTTNDAAVLEFDFVLTADTLSFSFVFASEEYNEYVNSYNDIFAIFLDGANVAIIPGNGTPISIYNINNCVNSLYYINNNSFPNGSSSCSPTAANANLNTQFDVLTVVISLNLPINPGTSHHLKIAIADVLDGAFDSAVFIKSASFNSGTRTVTPTITPTYTWTDTFTITPTLTVTPTFTPTSTITPTPSITATLTVTNTVSFTPSATQTRTATVTYTATDTQTITATRTMTLTSTSTPTITPTRTTTVTSSVTDTVTISPTRTMTSTTTVSPTISPTRTPYPEGVLNVYPNPASIGSGGYVKFETLPEASKVFIYTLSGELVTFYTQQMAAVFKWTCRNNYGRAVSPGIYYYEVIWNDGRDIRIGKIFLTQ